MKPLPGQMSLFADLPIESPDHTAKVEAKIAQWEEKSFVPVKWSATERKSFDEFALMLAWMISPPRFAGGGRIGSMAMANQLLAEEHKMTVLVQRFKTVRAFIDEQRELEKAGLEQKEMQEAMSGLLRRMLEQRERMTDIEVCLVMLEASLEAPQTRYACAEYMRAFAATFGAEQYCRLLGRHWEPINFSDCQGFRQSVPGAYRRFPMLDARWFAQFNEEAQRVFGSRSLWPGMEVSIRE